MQLIRSVFILLFIILFQKHYSQSIEIFGKVVSDVNIKNIHVIHRTSHSLTITNDDGTFEVNVELKDTLILTSVQFKSKEIIITQNILSTSS